MFEAQLLPAHSFAAAPSFCPAAAASPHAQGGLLLHTALVPLFRPPQGGRSRRSWASGSVSPPPAPRASWSATWRATLVSTRLDSPHPQAHNRRAASRLESCMLRSPQAQIPPRLQRARGSKRRSPVALRLRAPLAPRCAVLCRCSRRRGCNHHVHHGCPEPYERSKLLHRRRF